MYLHFNVRKEYTAILLYTLLFTPPIDMNYKATFECALENEPILNQASKMFFYVMIYTILSSIRVIMSSSSNCFGTFWYSFEKFRVCHYLITTTIVKYRYFSIIFLKKFFYHCIWVLKNNNNYLNTFSLK